MDIPELRVIEILKKNKIDFAATLPCDRIKALLPLISENIETVPLTREENGVGICAGVYLGGRRPVMVIQSTGLGNMINALMSLNLTYDIPLPVLVSWRGVYKESIEAQKPLGKKLPGILEGAGIEYSIIQEKDEIDKIELAIRDSFRKNRPHIVLISPVVWEGSTAECPGPLEICPRITGMELISQIEKPSMRRYEAIKILTEMVGDDIIASNLGIPSKELYNIKDRELNFYMLGSMGLVSSIGFGLAMVQKRHVYVIDGDGSLLMNPNALVGIGGHNTGNLTILAIDNATYGSTGNQDTCTCSQIDLEVLARASGINDTAKVHTENELKQALIQKRGFVHVIVKPENVRCNNIPYSAKEIKENFLRGLSKT